MFGANFSNDNRHSAVQPAIFQRAFKTCPTSSDFSVMDDCCRTTHIKTGRLSPPLHKPRRWNCPTDNSREISSRFPNILQLRPITGRSIVLWHGIRNADAFILSSEWFARPPLLHSIKASLSVHPNKAFFGQNIDHSKTGIPFFY